MNYKELVEEWHKSREYAFNYKFEIGSAFMEIYHYIAQYFGYDINDRLNNDMRVYPINEINEEIMSSSLYSLYGAITYDKFGWSALVLQINTNSTNKDLGIPKGYYRFIFYIKKYKDNWYFCIDDVPYSEIQEFGQNNYQQKKIENFINSGSTNYLESALNKLIALIPQKISWEKNYITKIEQKSEEITQLLISYLEIDDKKIKPYSSIKNIKTQSGYLIYKLNDWCTYTISVLLELNESTYPKLNYLLPFHLKYKDENWYTKFYDNDTEKQISSHSELINAINKICNYKDTFKIWLANGENNECI